MAEHPDALSLSPGMIQYNAAMFDKIVKSIGISLTNKFAALIPCSITFCEPSVVFWTYKESESGAPGKTVIESKAVIYESDEDASNIPEFIARASKAFFSAIAAAMLLQPNIYLSVPWVSFVQGPTRIVDRVPRVKLCFRVYPAAPIAPVDCHGEVVVATPVRMLQLALARRGHFIYDAQPHDNLTPTHGELWKPPLEAFPSMTEMHTAMARLDEIISLLMTCIEEYNYWYVTHSDRNFIFYRSDVLDAAPLMPGEHEIMQLAAFAKKAD